MNPNAIQRTATMIPRIPLFTSYLLLLASVAATAATPANLSAEQIVEKNIAARGGLAAWHAVQTLTTEGQLDAGGKPPHQLPYVMKQKRSHKTRLEILFKDQTSLQVFDGSQGWKVRPFLNRDDAEPMTPAETKIAAAAEQLDGPLIDYAAKGTRIALAGMESVEGHPAYRLELTLKNGEERNLWIDAGSFLELKMDGEPRKLDAKPHNVAIFFRDYKLEHGLNIPHRQDTVVEGVKEPYKMTVTKVTVNDPIDDSLFEKPRTAAVVGAAAKPN
jgi:hypothetical protein